MQAGQRNRCLSRMLRSASYRGHQPRPTGDSLTSGFWISQVNEEAPPVVDQRHCPRSQLAAVQVMRGETTPTPLIFEFIECILGIGPITIKLNQTENLVVSV